MATMNPIAGRVRIVPPETPATHITNAAAAIPSYHFVDLLFNTLSPTFMPWRRCADRLPVNSVRSFHEDQAAWRINIRYCRARTPHHPADRPRVAAQQVGTHPAGHTTRQTAAPADETFLSRAAILVAALAITARGEAFLGGSGT